MGRRKVKFSIARTGLLLAFTASAAAPFAQATAFQGRVYDGEVGDESRALAGVTVSLYGANNPYPDTGMFIRSTTTNESGWYQLEANPGWEFYHIIESNPDGFSSVGATSVSGTIRSADWIEYIVPLDGKTLTGNKFWDIQPAGPTPTPTRVPTPTATPTPTPSPTPTATPTPTPTGPPTPSAAPTPTPGGGTTLWICAVADAELDQAHPDANPGDGIELKVGYGQGQNEPFANRILLRFDLSFVPQGALIDSAHLEMRMTSADGISLVEVGVYPVHQPWDESTVTWNNQPTTDATQTAHHEIDTAVPDIRGWNVGALVQQWVDGSLDNNGVLLRGPEGAGAWARVFDSRHYTVFCPRLVITIASGEVIPTPTPTPTPTATPTPKPVCTQTDFGGDSFSLATAIGNGQAVEEYICPSGDADWFKIRIEASQEVSVFLYDLPTGPDADLDVFLVNPSGGTEASSEVFGADKGGYIFHTAWVTGDWRVMVKGKGPADWSPTQTYGLRVDLAFTCDFPDEAGDTLQSATEILPSLPSANVVRKYTGYICPQGDIDYYKVFVPPHQNVSINAKLTDLPADFDLALYSPDGTKVDDSTFGGTADEEVSTTASSQPGYWRIKVSGPGGMYHSRPYTLEVILGSNADLTVAGIEVTQAIQDMNNGVELAAGKIAVARVYVDPGLSVSGAAGVEVELHGWYHVGTTYKPFSSSPLKKGPMLVTNKTVENDKRLATGESFNFFLPKPWVTSGDIRLEARVNPQHTVPESNYSNNNLIVERVDVRNTIPLSVGLVPIETKGLVPTLNGNPALAKIFSWIRSAYPVGEIKLWYMVGTLKVDHDLKDPTGGGCGQGTSDLLIDLGNVYDRWENRPPNATVYGFLKIGVPTNWSGCGDPVTRTAVSFLNPTFGPVIAEEIGHAFKRLHSPSDRDSSLAVTNSDCRSPIGEDPSYPYYTSPTGTAYARCSIGEVGINVLTGKVFNPATTYDFMGYCWPKWVSPYTWEGIADDMPIGKSSAVKQSARQVLVAGSVVGNELSFRPWFWVRDRDAEPTEDDPAGPYTIELRDAAGVVLESRAFSVDTSYDDNERATGLFREWVPYPDSVAAIGVVFDGAEIGERTVSGRPPTVTIISPNGGEHWDLSGTARVSWEAGDADEDALAADVLVSTDLGASWIALAVNQTDQYFDVDLSSVPGGAELLVKVEVSDGVNTTSDVSDATFAAEYKAPIPVLMSPDPGTLVHRGDSVVLSGAALDIQDGSIDSERITWYSSIDGLIGASSDTVMSQPSCGAHEIVLEAANNEGIVAMEAADITVHGGCDDRVYVLPASAHVKGLEDTTWVSDLVLHNPSQSPAHVVLYLLDDGVSVENRHRVVVPSMGSVTLADVLAEAFGPGARSGAVLISSSVSLMASSRTYNNAESGTFGQYVSVEVESAAISGNELVTLIQLTRNADYRTNIGFTNIGQSDLHLTVDLFSSSGAYLGTKEYTIDPYSFFQATDILHKVGTDNVADAYAVIRAEEVDAAYFAYASIIDNRTGDPIYASPIETSAGALYIPAAAHLRGANRSNWRTDLEVFNPGGVQARFQIELLERDKANTNPKSEIFQLAARQSIRYEDVLDAIFSFSGAAALRITPISGTIAATSRTYNLLEDGTMGQFAPAVRAAGALQIDEQGRLIQLSQSADTKSGFRTNIGLTSASSLQMTVNIDLYDSDGQHIGTMDVDLDPFEHTQIDKIFTRMTSDAVEGGYATVRSVSDGARFLAFASVIDNRSADPIYVPARRTPRSGLWDAKNELLQPLETNQPDRFIVLRREFTRELVTTGRSP